MAISRAARSLIRFLSWRIEHQWLAWLGWDESAAGGDDRLIGTIQRILIARGALKGGGGQALIRNPSVFAGNFVYFEPNLVLECADALGVVSMIVVVGLLPFAAS